MPSGEARDACLEAGADLYIEKSTDTAEISAAIQDILKSDSDEADADVVVVVGTSGIVYPAAGLPEYALARGTVVVEVNPAPTPLSAAATVTIRDTATAALPGLLHRLPTLLGD